MRPLCVTLLGLLLPASLIAGPPEPPPAPIPAYPLTVRSTAEQFKDLIPALVDALKDTDPDVRQHSALALAAVGPDALKPLLGALTDASALRRAGAAYAIGQMGTEGREAIPELLTALKDAEPDVRRSAAQAVNRIVGAERQAKSGLAALFAPGSRPALGPPPLPRPRGSVAPVVAPPIPPPPEPDPTPIVPPEKPK